MSIELLVGKTLVDIKPSADNSAIDFCTLNGEAYRLAYLDKHLDSRYAFKLIGELSDLNNLPITQAYEMNFDEIGFMQGEKEEDTLRRWWKFYKVKSESGELVIRWHREAAWDFSVEVGFEKV
ncbi:MAG: hypothetical protein V4629_03210 [Pseudomonadota bacterium]